MMQRLISFLEKTHPPKLLLLGYLLYIVVGWLLLSLPFCHKLAIHPIDNLFIATSAVSTTGLTTIDVGSSYSFFGQLAILILIQLGGIGYSTVASFVILSTTSQLPTYQKKVASHTFSLPKGFVMHEFIRHVVFYTIVCEAIGAVALSFMFRDQHVPNYFWQGLFHSVSAFCTAGFSLFPNSFENYVHIYPINIVLSILSILGAMGFIVWIDVLKRITRETEEITFTTRIILSVTFFFLVFGTVLFYLTTSFPDGYTLVEKLNASFFQTMSASTTVGFDTMNVGSLSFAALTLLLFLMAFGASPSGTGGGLKSTTFVALLALLRNTLRGKDGPMHFLGREIPPHRVRIANSTFTYYIFVLVTSLFLFTILEDKPYLDLLFEASSALSTVGLSMGITSSLSLVGKCFLLLLMFMGRVGILTFGVALSVPHEEETTPPKLEKHDIVF